MGSPKLYLEEGCCLEKAVVLLSGGRDSFLSACIALENYIEIVPIFCNNGHIASMKRAEFVVCELQKRFSKDIVHDLVYLSTGMTMQAYLMGYLSASFLDISRKYPYATPNQIQCLACKSAMYAHAIAFAKRSGRTHLIDGVRKQQGFFVDLDEMHVRLNKLCEDNKIELLTPVYELTSDWVRKRELCDRGFTTKVIEPQCFLACPLGCKMLTDQERESLTKFYDEEIQPSLQSDIKRLESHMTW